MIRSCHNQTDYVEIQSGHSVKRMKILSNLVFSGSQQVKSKCMSPGRFTKEEQSENKMLNKNVQREEEVCVTKMMVCCYVVPLTKN